MEIANAIVPAMASDNRRRRCGSGTARRRAACSVPGDKSISHRYAMLAALADGNLHHHRVRPGADCAATLACLRRSASRVTPGGRSRVRRSKAAAFAGCAVAGAARRRQLRHDHAAAVGHPGRPPVRARRSSGDASLSRRPMRRVIEPLTRMGAHIESPDGRPPLTITGADLAPIDARPGGAERAGQERGAARRACTPRGARPCVEPAPTRDHTERALRAFGAPVSSVDGRACRSRAASASCRRASPSRATSRRRASGGARRRHAGRVRRDRGRRAEPIAHRRCSTSCGAPAPP